MRSPLDTPLEQLLANAWNGIDPAYRKAFLFILAINLLAFGFEMTNLTLHHDDVAHIFIQDTILGHYLGASVSAGCITTPKTPTSCLSCRWPKPLC